jgi:hypothetical protein
MDFRVLDELSVFPETQSDLWPQIVDCVGDPLFRPHIHTIEMSLVRLLKSLEKSPIPLSSLPLLALKNALFALPFFVAIEFSESKERVPKTDFLCSFDSMGLFVR